MMPSRIPREQIPWHPTVDLTKCTADQACVKFCPQSEHTIVLSTNDMVETPPSFEGTDHY